MIAENIIILADDMYNELVENLNENLSGKPTYKSEFNLHDLTIEQLNDLSKVLVDRLIETILESPLVENIEVSIVISNDSLVSVEENLTEYTNDNGIGK